MELKPPGSISQSPLNITQFPKSFQREHNSKKVSDGYAGRTHEVGLKGFSAATHEAGLKGFSTKTHEVGLTGFHAETHIVSGAFDPINHVGNQIVYMEFNSL